MKPVDRKQADLATGCLAICGLALVACILSYGLGYLAAWLIHAP